MLHRPEYLPDYVILIGDRGQVTVTDSSLDVKTSFAPQADGQTTLSSFVFPRDDCSFAPSRNSPRQSAIIVSLTTKGDALNAQTLLIDKDGRIKHLGTTTIPSLKSSVSSLSSSQSTRR